MGDTISLDKETLALLDQRDTKLSERVKADIAEIFAKAEASTENKEEIEHEQLGGIMATEIMGIPLGQALIGGGVALIVSELVDGIIGGAVKERMGVEWAEALIKGGSAWAVKAWGPGILGAKAADTAALFLAWEAIRSIIPIDNWIKGFFKKEEEKEEESSSSSSHSSESSSGGNGHQPDAMTTLRTSLAIGGR
ncbi:hypothetical protein ES708_00779 [subsurface metagenome]